MSTARRLRAAVEEAGGRLEMSVGQLRDAYGMSRLTAKASEVVTEDLGADQLAIEPPLDGLGADDRIVLRDVRPAARAARTAHAAAAATASEPAPPPGADAWETALQRFGHPEPSPGPESPRRPAWRRFVAGGAAVVVLVAVLIAVLGGGDDTWSAAESPAPAPPAAAPAQEPPAPQTLAEAAALVRRADAALSADDPAEAHRTLAEVDDALLAESPVLADQVRIVRHRAGLTERYLDAVALADGGWYLAARRQMLALVPFRDAGVQARAYGRRAAARPRSATPMPWP